MPGKEATATRLTTAGGGVDGGTLGAVGGAQNGTIAQANLPAVTLTTTITDPGHGHTVNAILSSQNNGTGGASALPRMGVGTRADLVVNNATGITASTALGGSGTAFKQLVQPTIVLNSIMRIL